MKKGKLSFGSTIRLELVRCWKRLTHSHQLHLLGNRPVPIPDSAIILLLNRASRSLDFNPLWFRFHHSHFSWAPIVGVNILERPVVPEGPWQLRIEIPIQNKSSELVLRLGLFDSYNTEPNGPVSPVKIRLKNQFLDLIQSSLMLSKT